MEEQVNSSNTLESHIEKVKVEWMRRIKSMNEKFIDLKSLCELTSTLYTERQIALEYNNTIMNKIAELNKRYNEEYARRYNHYKSDSNIYYKSDAAINAQVHSDMRELIYKIELMDKFSKYMMETVHTIDNMIYAIQSRVRMEEIINGIGK